MGNRSVRYIVLCRCAFVSAASPDQISPRRRGRNGTSHFYFCCTLSYLAQEFRSISAAVSTDPGDTMTKYKRQRVLGMHTGKSDNHVERLPQIVEEKEGSVYSLSADPDIFQTLHFAYSLHINDCYL